MFFVLGCQNYNVFLAMTQYSYQSGSVAQFMVQEVPRSSEQSGEEAGDWRGGTRSKQSRNLVPVEVRVLLQHREEDGPLHVHGLEVGLVELVGQVRSVEVRETSTSYLVEDHTGRIEVVHWHQEDDPSRPQSAVRDTMVRVVGALRSGREQSLVTAYRVSSLLDTAEMTSHLLEVTVLPLRLQKMQARAASLAQASFAGHGLIGVRGLPAHVLQHRTVPAPPSYSGDWLQPTPRTQAPAPRSQAPAFRSQVPALRHQAPAHWSQVPAPTMEPAAVELLRLIKANRSEMGATRQELRSRVRAGGRLEALLDYLAQEGHVYTTQDQDHFKATDA